MAAARRRRLYPALAAGNRTAFQARPERPHDTASARFGNAQLRDILIEQAAEVTSQFVVKHPHQGLRLCGLSNLEETIEAMAMVMLLNQPRDGALRQAGEFITQRAFRV